MRSWTNPGPGSTHIGPRQAKDLQKAVQDLHWEGRTHDELTGVINGAEHLSSYVATMSPVRAEVLALDEAIRESFGYTVTKANLRDVIAAYEAALPRARESRPVQDSRRTQEEDAAITAKMNRQHEAHEAKQAGHDALLAQVLAKAPAGTGALIVAEYVVDNSDPMTDYFSNQTRRQVAIGFRSGSREDFRQLHAAAAAFTETAQVEFTEHRDNYSMGGGNYLSDHGWNGAGSGWVVKSLALPARWAQLTEDAIPERQAPAAATPEVAPLATGGGVTVQPSSLGKPGVVEVKFAGKPAAETRAALKAHGFRWAPSNSVWYGRDKAFAQSLVAE
jgi:hypothetical protein